jgi:hypothetical protein
VTEFEWKPVQVQVKGMRLSNLIDADFQMALKSEHPGALDVALLINIPIAGSTEKSEKFDHVRIGHFSKEHQDQSILTIDCDRPETLATLQKILTAFFSREQRHFES